MPDGIVLIDKPRGCTSHDVVGTVRRLLKTREVGHAGTLDPMATGLLVVLVGEGTKLAGYLTADAKEYEARVRFGVATESLDADGAVVETRDGPAPSRDAVEGALAAMVGPMSQVPPAVSAVRVEGMRAYERARRGEVVELAPRAVVLERARLLGYDADAHECVLSLACSKGFYVRSLARDLAAALGTVAHLSALRRTRSGAFSVDEAHVFDLDGAGIRSTRVHPEARARALEAAVFSLAEARRAMPSVDVTYDAAVALAQGKSVRWERATSGLAGSSLPALERDDAVDRTRDEPGSLLVFTADRMAPVCIARVFADEIDGAPRLTSVRGFVPAPRARVDEEAAALPREQAEALADAPRDESEPPRDA